MSSSPDHNGRNAGRAPAKRGAAQTDLERPGLYINRELSLLQFQRRVLAQAQDPATPLLERLRFLTIASTNLDELFEVRVAGLMEQERLEMASVTSDGLTPVEVLQAFSEQAHALVAEQYRILNEILLPALASEHIRIRSAGELGAEQAKWARRYFMREVLPVLTPVALDPAHPFPRIINKSLNFMVRLEGADAFGRTSDLAVIHAPRSLPRLIALPGGRWHDFVLLSQVIEAHAGEAFPGMSVIECHPFRVTRNSDLWVDEEEVDDLLRALEGQLPRRNYGAAVRLEVRRDCAPEISEFLLEEFELSSRDLYLVDGPVNLHRLAAVYDLVQNAELKYRPFSPRVPPPLAAERDVMDVLRHRDILLHHPFDSFVPVVDLVRQAASDPHVLAIKQTLYRTDAASPIVEGLIDAAGAGKEVTVIVELRARFDEAANIDLATRLQEAGVNVVYGVVGYKAHAKMLLVVRREGRRLRRYVQLGTGNYHTRTAKAYTDLSYLTSAPDIGEDIHRLFLQLTGLGKATRLKKLLQSPFTLHKRLVRLIEQEAERARRGEQARIIAKMNHLSEPRLMRALYRASEAGVRIDLIVRTVCSLRPGISGISDNIRVRSIVGRFLEHSRVYYFYAGGDELVFGSSADWLERNMLRRVEVAFPIEDPELKARVLQDLLLTYLEDNTHTWALEADGSYRRLSPGSRRAHEAQRELLTRGSR